MTYPPGMYVSEVRSPFGAVTEFREAPLVRREAPVLFPAVGRFQFGRRPNVLFSVFVRARSALNQTLSLPVVDMFRFGRRPNLLLAEGELFVR